MNAFSTAGKLAMITGASGGIGFGAARALAESGANLILVGRDQARLDEAASRLRRLTSCVHVCSFDLMNTSMIASWFGDVCSNFGTPDILVNSAGITRRGLAVDLELADWNDVFQLNATAMFELARSFARHRIAQKRDGRVINVASLMTAAARPGTAPYTASKGAVGQLTKALAIEWAKYGILVNAIGPGYIDSALTKPLVEDQQFDQWVKDRCPLGRWGTTDDIAWPIVFLASPASGFITGQTIYVDGGWLATF